MRKKLLCGMVLAMALSACMVGCGTQDGDVAKSAPQSTATSKPMSEEMLKKLQEEGEDIVKGLDVKLDTISNLKKKLGQISLKLEGNTLTIEGKGDMPEEVYFAEVEETKNITKLMVGKGITSISSGAFKNCKKLKSVTLPKGLKCINWGSFCNTAIEKITIPTSTKKIYPTSFIGCKKLKKVTAPGNMKCEHDDFSTSHINDETYPLDELVFSTPLSGTGSFLDQNTFYTKSFKTCAKDPKYSSYKGVIYSKDGKKLLHVSRSISTLNLSSKVEEISLDAFGSYLGDDYTYSCKLNRIKLPSSVKKITAWDMGRTYEYAYGVSFDYSNCKLDNQSYINLAEITSTVNKPEDMPEIEFKDGMYILKGYYLYKADANKLSKKVVVPDGVTEIGPNAFNHFIGWDSDDCSFEEVVLPTSLKKIGKEAFADNAHLKKITIPDSVTEIGKGAFYCTNIQNDIPARFKSRMSKIYRPVN